MDERKMPQSERIKEWMNELLPDGAAADIGMWQQPECTSGMSSAALVKAERPNACQMSVDPHAYPRNLSQLHQLMQTSAGCNSASLMAKRDQDPLNVMQHSYQMTPQRIMEPKGGVVLERAHPRLQMPALHQPQTLTMPDQLKPGNQTPAMPFGALQESTSQVDLTNSLDWVNPTYQKILQMKEMYLSQFIALHHKMQELKRQATDAEMVNKWEKNKLFLEKTVRLLNVSKSDLPHLKMERVCQMLNDAMKFMSQIRQRNSVFQKQAHQVDASGSHIEAPHTQPRESHLQLSGAPAGLHQLPRPGGALDLPQSMLNSFNVGSSAGVHKVDALSAVNSYQYNLMRPTHQWAAPQGNVAPSPLKGAQMGGFDPRALRMLLHPSGGVSQYNNLGTLQQTVASSRNIFNSLDYSINPIAQTPVSMPPLQNNQLEVMKRQKMKQPVQQLMADKNKQQMLQKRTEDTKLRRLVGINQKWSPVLPTSSSPYAMSPQNSQQSSSQHELKDLSSKFTKSETPSLSSPSPSALPSPLTPMALITPSTPSSMPADCIKSPLLEESSKFEKNPATASQPPLQNSIHNQLATDTQRSNKSCLHKESTSFGDKKPSSHADPLKHLIEVVKSISSNSLNATLRDIDAVTSLTDRAAEEFLHGKPAKVIFHDLADDMMSNCGKDAFGQESSTSMKPMMKHELVTVALDDLTTDSEFGARGGIKRLKTEPNNLLLEEIKEINQKLIEMVVDVMTLEDVSSQGSGKGTLIRCSYIPVGLSGNSIKIPSTSKLMFPNLLLELIVSSDYPNSSPTVLEKEPSDFCDGDEGKYLWMKAKSNFNLSIRKYSMPISVKDMAEAWGASAREVFHELVEQMGGGSFSSNYGKWENCAVSV